MSVGVNKCILVGHLGKDPEVRQTQNSAVCTLRLAVAERRKEGDAWKDHTEWMDVVTWGKTAENAGKYLAKGSQVYVEGRLQTRQYKDKDGNDRWKTEVVARDVKYLGSPKQGVTSKEKPAAKAPPMDEGYLEDDLPF